MTHETTDLVEIFKEAADDMLDKLKKRISEDGAWAPYQEKQLDHIKERVDYSLVTYRDREKDLLSELRELVQDIDQSQRERRFVRELTAPPEDPGIKCRITLSSGHVSDVPLNNHYFLLLVDYLDARKVKELGLEYQGYPLVDHMVHPGYPGDNSDFMKMRSGWLLNVSPSSQEKLDFLHQMIKALDSKLTVKPLD